MSPDFLGIREGARVTTDEAQRLAAELYGLSVTARPLPGEYDDNFQVTTEAGDELVLKVARPGQPRAEIELQVAALAHLAVRAPQLAMPRVHPLADGGSIGLTATGDGPRAVWLLTWVPGTVLARASHRSEGLLANLGRLLGTIDHALSDFEHPAARRAIKWDVARAGWIREHLDAIPDPARRALVLRTLDRFEAEVVPRLPFLRRSVLHGDANDHNVVVTADRTVPREAVAVIDLGDMHESATVFEPAVAAAYALLGRRDPLAAAAAVIAGYHQVLPLTEDEVTVLFPSIAVRLAVSVTNSAWRTAREPGDPYLAVSEQPAWDALERLDRLHPRFALYTLRQACGLPPVPSSPRIAAYLAARRGDAAPVLGIDLRTAPSIVFDLSVGSLLLGADPQAAETSRLTATLFGQMQRHGVEVGVGRYGEARLLYTSPAFLSDGKVDHPTAERRTIHLGLDLFAAAGTPVFAPLAGVVHCVADNDAPKDYGPLVILRHETGSGETFYTLYGHLGPDALDLVPGRSIAQGERLATLGAPPHNGDWPPHLHLQVIVDLLDLDRDVPGVAFARRRAVWQSLSPDPNLLLGIPADRFPPEAPERAAALAARRTRTGSNLRLAYREPLQIVRGWKQLLYDETGRAYLDAFNNVAHVGHCHPRVVEAIARQAALLNTNTRYLHDNLNRYAERLGALLPSSLSVCYFVNSASEANELALRLARAHTGRQDVIVLEAAYHGHTTTLIDVSPYKLAGPGGTGKKPWVHVAPIPDDYRGPYRRDDPQAGAKYARHVEELAQACAPAAFLAETLPSVGGQIVPPSGYLKAAYAAVREAGGVCIADEVQVGFGRLGSHFWGFALQDAVPDIVVLGKPIANGHPMGAVVTTPEIAASFDTGMEFFSTFGGNPVSCAAALAVLDVLEEEGLAQNAERVGTHLLAGLRDLVSRHPIAGDARGAGFFLGLELVRDARDGRKPAPDEAAYVVNRLREQGILAGTDGPFHNVIKIRPPMVFTREDADLLLARLDDAMRER